MHNLFPGGASDGSTQCSELKLPEPSPASASPPTARSGSSEHLLSGDGECPLPVTVGRPRGQGIAAAHSFTSRELSGGLEGSGSEVGSQCPSEMPAGESRNHAGCLLGSASKEAGIRNKSVKSDYQRQMLSAGCSHGEKRRLFPNEQLNVK